MTQPLICSILFISYKMNTNRILVKTVCKTYLCMDIIVSPPRSMDPDNSASESLHMLVKFPVRG